MQNNRPRILIFRLHLSDRLFETINFVKVILFKYIYFNTSYIFSKYYISNPSDYTHFFFNIIIIIDDENPQ